MRGFALAVLGAMSLGVMMAPMALAEEAAKTAATNAAATKTVATKPLVTKAPVAKGAKRIRKARAAKAQTAVAPSNGSYSWTGLYGGVSAGYLSGASTWANTLPPANEMNPSVDQGMLGLQLGAQLHVRNSSAVGWILGAEFAYSGAFARSNGSLPCVFDPTQTCRTKMDRLLTVGGRLGLGYESWLLFGSGGYAQASIATDQLTAAGGCNGGLCDRTRAGGWYAGAGLEYKLARIESADVIVGIEWQHIRLDATRHLFSGGVVTANTRDVSASADVIRARLSLKFNPFANGTTNGDYQIDW